MRVGSCIQACPPRPHGQQLVQPFRAGRSQSGQARGTAGERDHLLLEARRARRARRERPAPAASGKAHGPAAIPPGDRSAARGSGLTGCSHRDGQSRRPSAPCRPSRSAGARRIGLTLRHRARLRRRGAAVPAPLAARCGDGGSAPIGPIGGGPVIRCAARAAAGKRLQRTVRGPGLEDHPVVGQDRHRGPGHPTRRADIHGPARQCPHHRCERRAPVDDLRPRDRRPGHEQAAKATS
jgi:hypothetical protein